MEMSERSLSVQQMEKWRKILIDSHFSFFEAEEEAKLGVVADEKFSGNWTDNEIYILCRFKRPHIKAQGIFPKARISPRVVDFGSDV